MGINNPIPRSLKNESIKAAKILASFIKPNQVLGADEIIPREVLLNAKGLAIITVLKAGFLFSGRAGSGVVVARLPDGSWSAPSAIVTAGAGVGGQIGAELTDFVFILNTEAAVESFAQYGSVTLGGNVSVAAGPLGRNAEVAGNASVKNVAAIFAYSKTKGLFAGVSLEGSAIVERREANRKFYGDMCKARYILSGRVAPPPACEPLMRVLDSRAFSRLGPDDYDGDSDYYNDIPSTFSDESASTAPRRERGSARSRGQDDNYDDDDDDYSDDSARAYYRRERRARGDSGRSASSWEDDIFDRSGRDTGRRTGGPGADSYDRGSRNERADKPEVSRRAASASSSKNKAVALYSFAGEQDGDLPFKKGDVITIIQKSGSTDDWWTGRIGNVEGIFPANYVELV
jgi:lipid-binding SYLF domain-containing protein